MRSDYDNRSNGCSVQIKIRSEAPALILPQTLVSLS